MSFMCCCGQGSAVPAKPGPAHSTYGQWYIRHSKEVAAFQHASAVGQQRSERQACKQGCAHMACNMRVMQDDHASQPLLMSTAHL
jgi:hypothetical protein